MCIHLFNPPEPTCTGPENGCGNCKCNARFYKLELPAFHSQVQGETISAWSVLLRYGAGFGLDATFAAENCNWAPIQDTFEAESQRHAMDLPWFLTYEATVDLDSNANAGGQFLQEWIVWIPGNASGGQSAGDAVLYRVLPNPAAGDTTQDYSARSLFQCLRRTRFHYHGSLNLDPNGESPAEALGWPPYVETVPYYPGHV